MPEQVILEFVGDPSGLKPLADAYKALGGLTDEQIEDFKKANETFAKRTAEITKQTSETKKLNSELSKEEKTLSSMASKAKEIPKALAGKEIKEAVDNMAKVGKEIDNATKKSVTLKTELRALKQQLSQLDEGSVEFQKLSFRAAQLEDRIGDINERVRVLASDTFKFDAAVDAVRGVTAAFSVAQGAAALFGDESEELQKALLKVQGATALLTGVQEIANQVTGQGAAKLAILSAAQRVQTFVTAGATAATNAFRVALLSIGIGTAIAGLIAIVTYWEDIAEAIGLSTKRQDDFIAKRKELLSQEKDFSKEYEGRRGQLKLELELLEKKGATEKEISDAKRKILEFDLRGQQELINRLSEIKRGEDDLVDIKLNNAKITAQIIQAEIDGLNKVKEKTKEVKKELENTIDLSLLINSDDINEYATELGNRIAQALQKPDYAKELGELIGKVEVPPIKIPIELERAVELKKYFEEQLPQDIIKGLQTVYDTLFQIANENRAREFEAQRLQLTEQRDAALNNENLTEAQKAAINERYRKQEAALRVKQFQAEKQAKIAQASINGFLAVTNILATVPGGPLNPATIASIALSAVTTASQIALIASQKPPAFRKGTKNAPEGMALVGEDGPELTYLEKGTKVITAPETKKILDKYQVPNTVKYNEVVKDSNGRDIIGIDPEAVAIAIAKEMAKQEKVSINIDANGFQTFLMKGKSTIQLTNKKFDA